MTLDALGRHADIRQRYAVLAEAADSVAHAADQKRRDAGRQRLPAAVVLVLPQRLPLLQERRQPVLLGRRRKPVPRDLRRRPELHRPSLRHGAGAASRSTPSSASSGPAASGACRPRSSSSDPAAIRPARTCWPTTRCSPPSLLPTPRPGTRSTYHKVLDREAWTHAVVSAAVVLEMDQRCLPRRARIVLGGVAPIPWRLPEVENVLAGQRITPELAAASRRERRSPTRVRSRRTPTRCR